MPRTRIHTTPGQLLADDSPEIRFLTSILRRLVMEVLPDATGRAYPGWRGIGYRHPVAGYICAIFLKPEMVKLGFEYGAMLPDTKRLLKPGPSAGKQVRYLEVREESGIDPEAIRDLLVTAVEFRSG